jgi:glycosyltransferase involved in cell wall biosynthesis
MSGCYFSIILPTYNRAAFLPRAIQSVLDQTFTNFELIIVDDGSTDNTAELVAGYSDSRLRYFKKENEERSIARNFGIAKAHGHYVCFLDSDDRLYTNHFSEAFVFVKSKINPEVFHLDYESIDEGGIRKSRNRPLPDTVNKVLIVENKLSCNGVFIRRDIALQFNFIHHRYAVYAEDTNLWIRLAARYTFHHISVITSVINIHERRSAIVVDPFILLRSTLLFASSLVDDVAVSERFGKKRVQNLIASRYLLAALYFSEKGIHNWACSLLIKSLNKNGLTLSSRTFWAVIRNILLK